MTSIKKLPLKFLVDEKKKKVVFAECDKCFIDILFSFLTMPIGNIIHILHENTSIGSMDNLYKSIENLGICYFNTEACKTMLLNPLNASMSHYGQLAVRADNGLKRRLFTCKKSKCAIKEYPFCSSVANTRCGCGDIMDFESYQTPTCWKENDGGGIFVRGVTKYLVTDELHIMPSSTASIQTIFEKLNVKDLDNIEEICIDLDDDSIHKLLKRCLVSESPLSDLYFSDTSSNDISKIESKFTFVPKIEDDTHSKKIKANLFRSKSRNRIVYAEGKGEGLADQLFSFLTFPVGAIVKCLGKHSTLGCVDNLYTSAENLNINTDYTNSERCKSKLLDPKLAAYLGCDSLPLSINEEPSSKIKFSGCDKCYVADIGTSNSECEHGIKHALLSEMNPKLLSPSKATGGGFLKKEIKFMITNDLEITPFSSFSSVKIVKKCNIDFTDLEEKEIEVGAFEALNLLKACLTSQRPLSDVFGALDKWQKM